MTEEYSSKEGDFLFYRELSTALNSADIRRIKEACDLLLENLKIDEDLADAIVASVRLQDLKDALIDELKR
jgi:hypothetical protein